MSSYEGEGYYHDYNKLVNKGPSRAHKKYRRYPCERGRSAENAVVSKTLYDPAGALSKKQRGRLMSTNANDFQFDVPYSLNRRNRWETINPKSLLLNNTESAYEVLVVDGVARPSTAKSDILCRVKRVHLLEDDDSLTTISTSGKAKELAYFTAALKERKEQPKDEPEVARIQFNIVKRGSATFSQPGKSSRRKKRNAIITKKGENDIDVYETAWDYCISEDEQVLAVQSEEENRLPSNSISLSDFITYVPSGLNNSLAAARKCGDPSTSLEVRSKLPKLPELVDISEATHTECIVEVLDIRMNRMEPFEMHEKVSALVPMLPYGRCVVHWFDSTRVSISNQPFADTLFRVFFELRNNLQTLRVRLNTNTQYSRFATRKDLFGIPRKSKDFDTLFKKLMDFIWDSRRRDYAPYKKNSRVIAFDDNFKTRVNSSVMAAVAQRCEEPDQFVFVKEQYKGGALNFCENVASSTKEGETLLCCVCESSLKTDLFPSSDGMICKDCVASKVLHQLRLKQFPLNIPLITNADCSSLDLLYAILPMPVMSTLIKMSFFHFYTRQNPEAVFAQCPHCRISLVVNVPNGFNCCVCPDCKFHWCHRCCWEPHWPMSCEEFQEWSRKWEDQYLFERLHLDKDEKALRITCDCSLSFYAPESTAHGTSCPNKTCVNKYFDKSGLMRIRGDWWSYTPTFRKRYIKQDEKLVKCGTPVQIQSLSPKRVINKEFAAICADARDLRFDKKKREEFEGVVSKITKCKSEQNKLMDTRRTVLLLVEHCTAWLYLHRGFAVSRDLKSVPLRLLERVRKAEGNIKDRKFSEVTTDMEQLKKDSLNLISVFRKALEVNAEAMKTALTDGYETI